MIEPRFLLDTNILVYLLADSSAPLRERVESFPPGSLVTSCLCAAEVLLGLAGDDEGNIGFSLLLRVIEPVPFDLAAAHRFVDVPFRRGRLDRLIAAHCLALGLTLVTNNETDFEDVPDLRIENWARPWRKGE